MRTANFQFSECGGSLNFPDLFTELLDAVCGSKIGGQVHLLFESGGLAKRMAKGAMGEKMAKKTESCQRPEMGEIDPPKRENDPKSLFLRFLAHFLSILENARGPGLVGPAQAEEHHEPGPLTPFEPEPSFRPGSPPLLHLFGKGQGARGPGSRGGPARGFLE